MDWGGDLSENIAQLSAAVLLSCQPLPPVRFHRFWNHVGVPQTPNSAAALQYPARGDKCPVTRCHVGAGNSTIGA